MEVYRENREYKYGVIQKYAHISLTNIGTASDYTQKSSIYLNNAGIYIMQNNMVRRGGRKNGRLGKKNKN